MEKRLLKNYFRISGTGTMGMIFSLVLEAPLFLLSLSYGWLPMKISLNLALVLSSLLFLLFFLANLWIIDSLPFEKRGKQLIKKGPYRFVRHPSYLAKLILFLPGLAVLFRVWLPILSLPVLAVVWGKAAEKEERELKKNFGQEFESYKRSTGKFFPLISFIENIKKTK